MTGERGAAVSGQQHRIEAGQEYERHDPREGVTTCIRVLRRPVSGAFGDGKVWIATVGADSRELRPRYIATRQLHATGTVGAEELPRKTGYVLVRHADGSPVTP